MAGAIDCRPEHYLPIFRSLPARAPPPYQSRPGYRDSDGRQQQVPPDMGRPPSSRLSRREIIRRISALVPVAGCYELTGSGTAGIWY